MKYLNFAYRWVGTTLFWIFFGLIGLFMGFVVFPLLSVFVWDGRKRQVAARKLISAAFSLFVWVACSSRLISIRVTGMEHVDPRGGQLILATHPTLIDVVILISLFPQVDCVIKEAVTKNPVLGISVRLANYISNREPADLLDSCVQRLESGASLLLFPSGTREVNGQPLRFKLGAAEVAIRARASILPVALSCKPQMLAKHVPWYRIPPSAPRFKITVLPPIAVENLTTGDVDQRHARYQVNDALVSLFDAELS
ncbi:MAG: 1-acyl-sn-glycerol-3-phosphate acyltransferase [Gammaproteobacteria bacterium]|nr:1-acyl-sn-glycerol-3-phosphate acyltransferase [Gammaproteobacteria bacterium]MDH3407833.1 1-acyl-sn-glycerol-3-phosphate acyltransferase [Gammaproteobacteria bacterium]MDH3552002.1 1-acyl-sn-glycerol-3-phosphate acyltransferase [Gammaproteobacteria bacterium]